MLWFCHFVTVPMHLPLQDEPILILGRYLQRYNVAHANAEHVRGTLGLPRVRSKYADIRRCTQRPNCCLNMFKMCQRMRAYSINVTHAPLHLASAYNTNDTDVYAQIYVDVIRFSVTF